MRTSLNIEADSYDFASDYASARGLTLGAAVSELIRRAQAPLGAKKSESPRLQMNEHGYFEIIGGSTITSEMVKEHSEDPVE